MTKEYVSITPEKRVEQMTPFLLEWFSEYARILPWREKPLPYYVWISEIMLQQTRVEAVKPYFASFIEALPNVKALAECEEEKLLKLWEGLGYYSRARNLKKAARIIIEEYEGEIPADYKKLLKLPGIGSYTAGAIASIAYGIPVPAVDGNVLRVMARLSADSQDILKPKVKKTVEELLARSMPKESAGTFNQAMMELGATICLPNGEPKCKDCPIEEFCVAHAQNRMMEFPVKTQKKPRKIEKKTIFVIHDRTCTWLRKREEKGLLSGLYELPNKEGALTEEEIQKEIKKRGINVIRMERLPDAKHIFSHVEWHMIGYEIWIKSNEDAENFSIQMEKNGYVKIEVERVRKEYAIPTAFAAYAGYLEEKISSKE